MTLSRAACMLWLLGACPDASSSNVVQASCTKAYAQCVLPSGVLGVCDPVACAPEQAAPCLVCRSQH